MVAEESWITPKGGCCEPDVTQCNRSYCFFAEVQGPSSFWISGCTDDEFNGCDQHDIPYSSILLRCQCQTDFCNPINRIPQCSRKLFNNTVTKSGRIRDVKGAAWTNQINSLTPTVLILLAGWRDSAGVVTRLFLK